MKCSSIKNLEQLRLERVRNRARQSDLKHSLCGDVRSCFSVEGVLLPLLSAGKGMLFGSRYFRAGYRLVRNFFR